MANRKKSKYKHSYKMPKKSNNPVLLKSQNKTKANKSSLKPTQKHQLKKNRDEIQKIIKDINISKKKLHLTPTAKLENMKKMNNNLFIQESDFANVSYKFQCKINELTKGNLTWWKGLKFTRFENDKMEINIPMLFETKETDKALWKQCQSKLQQSQPYSADANKKGELGEQFRGVINRYTKCLSKRKSDLLGKAFGLKQQQEVPTYLPTNDLSVIHTDIPAEPNDEEMETDAATKNLENLKEIQHIKIPALSSTLKETHISTPQSDGNKTTCCEEKLRKYMSSHPCFKWDKIIDLINRYKHLPDSNKNCAMSLLSNEYFMSEEDETIVRSYDLNLFPEEISWWGRKLEQENWSKFAQFDGGMLKINIPKLFTESKSVKKEVKDRLKGALDTASSNHPFGQRDGLSTEANLNKYLKRLSKRKNDFITSVILKNTSSLKRGQIGKRKVVGSSNNMKFMYVTPKPQREVQYVQIFRIKSVQWCTSSSN